MTVKKIPTTTLINSSNIYLDKISFSWPDGKQVLNECSFSISKPGLWMIVGKNGSGKSTLFRLLNGMLKQNSGEFICKLKPFLMFQNPDHHLLLPTCQSDLLLNIPRGLTEKQISLKINEALDCVGMSGMETRPIHTLSGGQKQRLALAGALVSESNLLLLDEPTALLDPISQRSVLEIVSRLCRRSEDPITALWITHRLDELLHCFQAAIMEEGRIGPWSSGQDLFDQLNPLAIG
nr:ABC transporter ATP-binding protein [Prochlorococcus sp. MIT 1223]